MAYGHNSMQCARCGQDRVILYIKVKGPYAILKAICPNDRSKAAIRLPIGSRDQWIHMVADNIYRCAICGQPLQGPAKIGREGRWIVLYMECPTHGLKSSKRHVIDTIYPAIETIHNNPMGAMSGPATFSPPGNGYPPPPPPPSMANAPPPDMTVPPPPPPDAFVAPAPQTPSGGLQFCPDCGARIQPGALFCTACGTAIEDDYDQF